jgi:DNA polymerase
MSMDARLASETDLAGFREEARALLAHQIPPGDVRWQTAHAQNADFFIDPLSADRRRPPPNAASAIVPASFLRLCEVVVLHHDPDRFALLYRLLWRLVHEPALRHDPIDPDMLHAHQMGQAVRRDIHKMKTFVKFHEFGADGQDPMSMVFYEPAHHIVEAVAPWFAKRMPQTRCVIFTPECSVESDGHQFHFAGGIPRLEAPSEDAPARVWLDAYRRIFGSRAILSPS